jgi:SpoVK/Ycf46/Vps4 family AAA+-type ATPase
MYTILKLPNINDYNVVINNNKKFNSDFLMIQSKVYKINLDNKIKTNIMHIKGNGYISEKMINVFEYNITEIIDYINIDIINSSKNEINEDELINNIYMYLSNLFVFDNMNITMVFRNIDYIELKVSFNKYFNKYYLINDKTNIIINNTNYKLYKNIIDIDRKNLTNIIFDISYISGTFKRNLLDDICLLNKSDLNKKLEEEQHSLYINKSFNIFSNNCEFNVKISFMKIILDDNDKLKSANSIFNFISNFNDIDKKYKFDQNTCFNKNYINCNTIIITIKDGPQHCIIYDINNIKTEILNIFKFNYIKLNDTFKILVDNDLLTLQITSIDNTIYVDNFANTTICVSENSSKKIYAYDLNKVHNVKSIDVIIEKYDKPLNLSCLFGGKEKETNISEINISKIKLLLYNMYYFSYSTKYYNENNFMMRFNNIIVENCEELDKCLLRINLTTKINIINEESNLKLINDDLKPSSKINMSIEEIKNITIKLNELGITGMNDQINKIIKEILLPRSDFFDESFKKFVKIPKGVMLYGPPGTGKTTLARNLAKIIGIPDYRINMINGTSIFSKWLGESEQNIRELFEKPRNDKNNLYVLIIDEADSIFKSRDFSESCKSDIVNQFLGEMDGLEILTNILIIGITNRIESLDAAILRPGRFSSKIYCGLPDEQQRLQIIKLYHNRLTTVKFQDINFDNMVKLTIGFSGAQIEYIYVKVIELVIEKQFNGTEITITNEIITDIMKQI